MHTFLSERYTEKIPQSLCVSAPRADQRHLNERGRTLPRVRRRDCKSPLQRPIPVSETKPLDAGVTLLPWRFIPAEFGFPRRTPSRASSGSRTAEASTQTELPQITPPRIPLSPLPATTSLSKTPPSRREVKRSASTPRGAPSAGNCSETTPIPYKTVI